MTKYNERQDFFLDLVSMFWPQATLSHKETLLREWFLHGAKVLDRQKGYIDIEGLNRRIDIRMQGFAADLIAWQVRNKRISLVIPVSNAGDYFGCAVAQRLRVDISAGRKGLVIPANWKDAIITQPTHSFTTNVDSQIVSYCAKPDDVALIADDFLASAGTITRVYERVRERTKATYCGFYAVKFFDEGPNILKHSGIEYFYALGIEEIDAKDRIVLRPPQYAKR